MQLIQFFDFSINPAVFASISNVKRPSESPKPLREYYSSRRGLVHLRPIEIPKFRRLHGKEAIKGLHEFVAELEEYQGERLTTKQTDALIRMARALISSIEAKEKARTLGELNKPVHAKRFSLLPPFLSWRDHRQKRVR